MVVIFARLQSSLAIKWKVVPIDGPEMGHMVIFKDVIPIYMRVNFLKWCEIGIAEVGASRQLKDKVIKLMQTEFIG